MTEIVGTPGDDTLNGTGSGTSGGDTITGLAGNDDVTVGPNDNADGGADTDTLSVFHFGSPVGATIDLRLLWNGGVGSNGSGLLTGFEHLGYILGSNGNDIIRLGTSGAVVAGLTPFARGHEGDDFLEGGGDLDRLQGDEGNDLLLGFGGDDQLQGNSGVDRIEGGEGDDSINGGLDADVLIGGVGSDTYVYGDGSMADEDQIIENAADAGLDRLLVRANVGYVVDSNFANVRNIEIAELSTLNDVAGFEFTLSAQFEAAAFQTIIASADIDASLTNRNYSYVITPPNIRDLTILAGSGNDNFSLALYAPYAGSVFAINGGAGNDSITFSNSVGPISFDIASGALLVNGLAAGFYVNFENVTGSEFSDVLTGSSGDNVIIGGNGIDQLVGLAGDDVFVVDILDSIISGGSGTDRIVFGGSGTLAGALSSIEAVQLLDGASLSLSGTQFANGLAKTTAVSGTGSITVNMDAGINFLSQGFAFTGSNVTVVVNGSSGADIIKAGGSAHIINGGGGADQIRGGTAADAIDGGADNDKILGFTGADIITGGAGNDQFRYLFVGDSGLGAGADRITDFTSGSDRLNFALLDTNAGLAGIQGFAFVGNAVFSGGGAASIRYTNSGADLLVQADINGDGVADMEIVLQGLNGGTLTAGDFIL
jgi:Ca2+-binding RTX toxin-like protein